MPTKNTQEETPLHSLKKNSGYTIFFFPLRTDGVSLILFNYQLIGIKDDQIH